MRFHSDETIQYTGFKAVYTFIENPLEHAPDIGKCSFDVSGHQVSRRCCCCSRKCIDVVEVKVQSASSSLHLQVIDDKVLSIRMHWQCFLSLISLKDFIGTDNITDARRKHAVTFGTPVDCVWAIHAAKGHQISLSFPEGGWKLKHPNDCHLNYIQVRLELHRTAESEMEFLIALRRV